MTSYGSDGPDVRGIASALLLRVSVVNVGSAILASGLAWLVVPGAQAPGDAGTIALNGAVLAVYSAACVLSARVLTRRWITGALAGREAASGSSPEHQRGVLRLPLRTATLVAGQWIGALVVFAGLNAGSSPRFAVAVAVTILFTGMAMCAVAYWVSDRLLRPLTAAVLAAQAFPSDAPLGVAPRQVLGWILGTGSAVVGLLVIGVVELAAPSAGAGELRVAIVVFCAIALVGGLTVEVLAAQSIATRLRRLRAAFAAVRDGDLDAGVDVDDGTDVGRLQAGFNGMVEGLREREQLRDAFGRHVGQDVAERALTPDGVRLGGVVQELAALFVDLEGSTELAAERPPHEVLDVLNRFFAIVVDVVERHGGTINKFQGDAVLAVFGAPEPSPSAAGDALAAARALGARLAGELPSVGFGTGVSGGEAVAGNVGAERRLEFTVIGDPVNEAARLSDLAKHLPGSTAASQRLVGAAAPDEARRWRAHSRERLRGRAETTTVMTPLEG